METRVAVVGIVVEDPDAVETLNRVLHQYAQHIVGRMGIPYRQKGISVISVVLDAPQDIINALSGTIGRIPGVNAKTAYASAAKATS